MKDLIINYITLHFKQYFYDYGGLSYTGNKEVVYDSFLRYSKEFGKDDILYLIDLEYLNTEYVEVRKTITISSEQIMVFLFNK